MPLPPQHLLPNFLDLLLDTVFLVDREGTIVYVSAACERMLGYTQDEMIGRWMLDLVAPEDRERTIQEASKVIAGEARIGFENRYIHKNGSYVHIMWSARFSEADGLRVGVARDITERKRFQERQAATYAISEAANTAEDLPALFAQIHRILARWVPIARLAVATRERGSQKLTLVYPVVSAVGETETLRRIVARQATEALVQGQAMQWSEVPPQEGVAATDAAGSSVSDWLVVPLVTQSGVLGVLALNSLPGKGYSQADRDLLNFVSNQVATAIRRKQLSAELLRSARYDELTGLPNRRQFHERVGRTLARSRRKQRRLALLFLDIDQFKPINDIHGHGVGDRVLQVLARRLREGLREEDAVFRLGGDEFVVLLEEIRGSQDVQVVVGKVDQLMREPIELDNLTLCTSVSIGMAVYPDDGHDINALLQRADRAMYQDKRLKQG